MAKPLVVFADPERLIIDYLRTSLAARGQSPTVGVGLPAGWTVRAGHHVAVASDGTPSVTYPVTVGAMVRVTTWAESTTAAKTLASLCMGLLLAHPGDEDVDSVTAMTGVLPARDPDNGAPIASVTVRANLRPHAA